MTFYITHLDFIADLEPIISLDELLKLLSQPDMKANVVLKASDSVGAHHEPEFEAAEATAEGHAPVAVVDGAVRVAVLEVERVNH